ncbi:MAG: hypothetical protein JJT89_02100 [Nitriliruptoraceae bacterium]|nr:hypothetical protein [Nitriliruptoraceae bacterium]
MTPALTGFLLALVVAYGVFLVFTAIAFGWRGLGVSPGIGGRRRRPGLQEYLVQAGLDNVRVVEFVAVQAVLLALGFGFGFAIYRGVLPGLAAGVAVASIPIASARSRRARRLELARDNWPRMIEEIRLQAVTLGRSIPQALFSVGLAGPAEMRPAFLAAQREWLISTDFDRTMEVLKGQLADPTADAVCETLLIAHDIGGTDVDARLRALIDDRTEDLQGRKDARAKQAGVRFARWFVVVVPIGMALVGITIGEGADAYATPFGQLMVLVGFSVMAVCWIWAGHLLKLPEEERVFYDAGQQVSP